MVRVAEDTARRTRAEKVPPHNLEAEESVLGSMMLSVEAIAVGSRICRPKNDAFVDRDGVAVRQEEDARLQKLLSVASLCSETEIEERDGRNVLNGSATENALIQAALDSGIEVLRLRRDFVRRFEESIGRSPHPYAVYAAQAAELLLDALGRSDGSRAQVSRAVLRVSR